jgi:hypothetical protein
MKPLPAINLAHPGALIAAVFTPWIAAGIALLIGFFASYLTALSWADLTFVFPQRPSATSSSPCSRASGCTSPSRSPAGPAFCSSPSA